VRVRSSMVWGGLVRGIKECISVKEDEQPSTSEGSTNDIRCVSSTFETSTSVASRTGVAFPTPSLPPTSYSLRMEDYSTRIGIKATVEGRKKGGLYLVGCCMSPGEWERLLGPEITERM
jgi:hypothetical protein